LIKNKKLINLDKHLKNKTMEQSNKLEQLMELILGLQEEISELKKDDQNLPKLYMKMHKVMSAVPYIKKDKKNTFHNYEYASEEAIKKAVQHELTENKLLFRVVSTKIIDRTKSVNERGKETTLTTLQTNYEFIDVETGAKISGSYDGEGQDPLDKGVYKALTGALKYIITSHFLIPTGNDPEDDSAEKGTAPQTKAPQTKSTPPQQKPAAPTKAAEKKWLTNKQVQDLLVKIPKADLKQLDATTAWMGAHRITNINKFGLDQAIAMRRNELDGTPIPANLLADNKEKK
jgi:hypothetical protein